MSFCHNRIYYKNENDPDKLWELEIFISDSLLKHKKMTHYCKKIITADEIWIVYNNVEQKRSWRNEPPLATPKSDLHPKKLILCIWWDWKGIVYFLTQT